MWYRKKFDAKWAPVTVSCPVCGGPTKEVQHVGGGAYVMTRQDDQYCMNPDCKHFGEHVGVVGSFGRFKIDERLIIEIAMQDARDKAQGVSDAV